MIFGRGNPIIKLSGVEYELFHTGIIPVFKDKHQIENISPINGVRTFIDLWNLAEFKLRMYLWQYDDPGIQYDLIQPMENTEVYFKPHKYQPNGVTLTDFIKDSDGDDLLFHCTQFRPYYLNNINKFDVVEIIIKSTKPAVMEAYDLVFPWTVLFESVDTQLKFYYDGGLVDAELRYTARGKDAY